MKTSIPNLTFNKHQTELLLKLVDAKLDSEWNGNKGCYELIAIELESYLNAIKEYYADPTGDGPMPTAIRQSM